MKRMLFCLPLLVWLAAGCVTTSGSVADVQDISGGIGIVVDASTVENNTVTRNEFSIAENIAITSLVAKSAAAALERKGYVVAGTAVGTAGARLEDKDSFSVVAADGKKTDAPEAVKPPFAAEPPLSDAALANAGPLFTSLHVAHRSMVKLGNKGLPTVNSAWLDVAPDGEAVLAIICEGHVPSGGSRVAAVGTALVSVIAATAGGSGKIEGEVRTQSNAEIYLIDRRSGAVLWHDQAEGHDVSPVFFANEVSKMLDKLPPLRAGR